MDVLHFSVAGLPPAGGYLGKLALFQLSVDDHQPVLAALIFVGGALSFVYMFQLYRRRTAEIDESTSSPIGIQALLVTLGLAVLFIGVYPEPLLEVLERASQALPEGRIP